MQNLAIIYYFLNLFIELVAEEKEEDIKDLHFDIHNSLALEFKKNQ